MSIFVERLFFNIFQDKRVVTFLSFKSRHVLGSIATLHVLCLCAAVLDHIFVCMTIDQSKKFILKNLFFKYGRIDGKTFVKSIGSWVESEVAR